MIEVRILAVGKVVLWSVMGKTIEGVFLVMVNTKNEWEM
jgi:hypothetical protein